ncbi:hypothetical protein [Shewanella sp. CG12_big_fil_rev_8_21_14_0_65_47_15]|uniref:hypothetical protein n=1 Tax=Shewanella sp. CG12_big_fil_rev_8_21_14_0_65_47_15 TaxID=1975537 RepID=UPI000CBB6E46|nr:hypothetical protein [Shewanella sp. CG12_big_fil_rev_8_21_14_0_65_47_15]PIW60937.1 MAG: hypothetical protein COW15_10700 [Shewanella sp. CG12_big_fil_rev_8_21_14_0_65_47_15]
MTVDVDNILKDLRAAAKYFLLAEESFGAESMLQVTDGLIALSSHLPPQAQYTLNQLVGQAFAAQQRHDLIGLADYLNVELYDFIQQLDKQSVN